MVEAQVLLSVVTAHLGWFEEDLGSEVVFWWDEWSIGFGPHWPDVGHVHDRSLLLASLLLSCSL